MIADASQRLPERRGWIPSQIRYSPQGRTLIKGEMEAGICFLDTEPKYGVLVVETV